MGEILRPAEFFGSLPDNIHEVAVNLRIHGDRL